MTEVAPTPRRRILAVSSGGGHWTQLLRMRSAFAGHDVTWVTVNESSRGELDDHADFRTVRDATRWDRIALIQLGLQTIRLMLAVRPDVVISTGAAPGFLALRMGRLVGARTVWIDSIANVEEMSLSGRRMTGHVDLCLTQWPHLADPPDGPSYLGAVL